MNKQQQEISERNRRLNRLLLKQTYVYYHGDEPKGVYRSVLTTARKLYEDGQIQIAQRRNPETRVMEYMATGLLTENRMRKARESEEK